MAITLNYIRLSNSFIKDLFSTRVSFAYMDLPEYVADKILKNHGITNPKFEAVFEHHETPYCVVIVSIKKKEVKQFVKAMHVLRKNMRILGHDDYEKEYTKVFSNIRAYDKLTRI